MLAMRRKRVGESPVAARRSDYPDPMKSQTQTMKVRTTFARGINPFTNQPVNQIPPMNNAPNPKKPEVFSLNAVKKPKKATVYTNPDELEISNDPIPASRVAPLHKYHQKFSQLKIGQGIRCTTDEVGKVAGAMRKFIELKGAKKTINVKAVTRYTNPKTKIEDVGYGRVWMAPASASTH